MCPPPIFRIAIAVKTDVFLFLLFFSVAKQIVENIQARVWTATAVLEAYLARAAQAQEATNCLTEGARPISIVVFFELTFPSLLSVL